MDNEETKKETIAQTGANATRKGTSIRHISLIRICTVAFILLGLAMTAYGFFGYQDRKARVARLDELWKQMSDLDFGRNSIRTRTTNPAMTQMSDVSFDHGNTLTHEQIQKLEQQWQIEFGQAVNAGSPNGFLVMNSISGITLILLGMTLLLAIRRTSSSDSKKQSTDNSVSEHIS